MSRCKFCDYFYKEDPLKDLCPKCGAVQDYLVKPKYETYTPPPSEYSAVIKKLDEIIDILKKPKKSSAK